MKFYTIKCDYCNNIFERNSRDAASKSCKNAKHSFCSMICKGKFCRTRENVVCKQCKINFTKTLYQIKVTKNNFCSKSCAAKYNNTHKIKGTRVSKLETWLQQKLTEKYPDLEIHYNRKDAINSELDIFIPSLKLAFELNGIFHYEPIFGKDKLDSIQNNDKRKYQACIENKISLCVIDTNSMKNFKEQKANYFFGIISSIIDDNLSN